MNTEKEYQTRVSVYGLIRQDSQMLLCRLSELVPRWTGYWTLPGGGVDFGEHPEATLVREVKEETGLDVTVDSLVLVDSVHEDSSVKGFHGIRIVYRATVVGGVLRAEVNGTTDYCQWMTPAQTESEELVDLVRIGISHIFGEQSAQ